VERALETEDPQQRKQTDQDKEDCEGCGKKRAQLEAQTRAENLASLEAIEASRRRLDVARGKIPPQVTPQVTPQDAPEDQRPILVLLTAMDSWNASYSLSTVILDQARAGVRAGFTVRVVGMDSLDPSKGPVIPGVRYEGIIPGVGWVEDEIDEYKVARIKEALLKYLQGTKPQIIITHDLLLQTWYTNAAAAIHAIAPEAISGKWYHQVHSSVGARPEGPVAAVRASMPPRHRLAAINYSDMGRLMAYYKIPAENIVHLPNIKDPVPYMGLTADARRLIEVCPIHEVDVSQVYPLSTPRAEAKGIMEVIETFAQAKQQGASVALLILNAHANGPEPKAMMDRIKTRAREAGLESEECMFLSEIIPERTVHGVDQQTVSQLFQLSSVFCFPSTSESCGLVMLEAALGGNLLVLNQSLQALQEYIPHTHAIYVKWPSIRESLGVEAAHQACSSAAEQILAALNRDRTLMAKREVLKNWGQRRLVQALQALR
jgi:hypothetical protein